ncbi:DNA cytosine methyltransferase (plasmid) [Sutcliffiella horikoshii]|uniref:DNA cytosine methyltransferase n=1 Tax=Sutcliffiella horikoshii TaxID=79883 RepID=UPI001CBF4A43|nr:DNA cytosine methyltransferase [Sutcliffiella horikoshii]UAL49869.1 DNA cytosine methyltransferase [Sutcliffiella horikoshii]
MKILLNKIYSVREKAKKPGIWLQSLVCETANLNYSDQLFVSINEQDKEITLRNYSCEDYDHSIKVSGRENRKTGIKRPIVDTAGEKYANILDVKQKVEVRVYREGERSEIIIRPLHYNLTETVTLTANPDQRFKVLSVCAGVGIGTEALISTGLYSSVQEIEMELDAAEVLKFNHPYSYLVNADMRDVNEVVEADLAFLTLPCSSHSKLGDLSSDVMNNLAIAAAKIIKSSRAKVLFFENVPQYFKSDTWRLLKDLIVNEYPYFSERQIEAYDFGSIALRNRVYCVAFRDEELFEDFQFPQAPKVKRKKLKDFLDSKHVTHDWKSVDEWMDKFKSRASSWKDRSLERTFVTREAKKLNSIPKRYRAQCASSSYVLSEDKKSWRFLTNNEIRRILAVPESLVFPSYTPMTRIAEFLGQSVDCRVIQAIGSTIGKTLYKYATKSRNVIKELKKEVVQPLNESTTGQLELVI